MKLLTKTDLAKRWGITLRTLENWERKGRAPNRTSLGRKSIRYSMKDVLAYEQSNSITPTEGNDHE